MSDPPSRLLRMPSPTFKAVGKTELLSQTVESAIEAAIRSGEYEVGEKLPSEMELGAQFGVSRTVMREALRMLSARSTCTLQPSHDLFLVPLSCTI